MENETEAKILQEILQNEVQKKAWPPIHRELKQTRNPSPTRVEVPPDDDTTRECTTKEQVKEGIAKEMSKRPSQVDSAQVCQGSLLELLGYSADTETAIAILEGMFVPSPGTTVSMLINQEEIARRWEKMDTGEVNTEISQKNYQYYWKRAKDISASSFSGLHFGYYKAPAYSSILSETDALKLSLIPPTGSASDRWTRGLSVMLEKVAGVALVTKLRVILLMEADFNYHNRLIFGS